MASSGLAGEADVAFVEGEVGAADVEESSASERSMTVKFSPRLRFRVEAEEAVADGVKCRTGRVKDEG